MSQYCPKCGTENVNEAKFCKNCGLNLSEVAGKKNADEIRREKTAKELEDYKTTINGGNAHTSYRHNDSNVIIGTLIVSILIILVIYFFIRPDKSESVAAVDYVAPAAEAIDYVAPAAAVAPVVEPTQDKFQKVNEYLKKGSDLIVKDPKQAIYFFNKGLEIDPNNSGFYYDMAIAYEQLKEPEKALHYYSKAIPLVDTTMNPKGKAYAYSGRGGIYWQMGNIQKAKADAKKACALGDCQLKKDMIKWEKESVPSADASAPYSGYVDAEAPPL